MKGIFKKEILTEEIHLPPISDTIKNFIKRDLEAQENIVKRMLKIVGIFTEGKNYLNLKEELKSKGIRIEIQQLDSSIHSNRIVLFLKNRAYLTSEINTEINDFSFKRNYGNITFVENNKQEVLNMHPTGFSYEPLNNIKIFDKDGNQINLFNLTIPNIDYNEEYYKFKQADNTVIVNGSTVIVILPDGTKGVAKCVDDIFTINKGYQIALIRAKIKQHKGYINYLHQEMEDNIKEIHLQIENEQSQMKARIRHLEYLID